MQLPRVAIMVASAIVGVTALFAGTAALSAPVDRPLVSAAVTAASTARAKRVDVVGDSLVRQAGPRVQRDLSALGFDHRVVSEPGQSLGLPFVRAKLDEAAAGDAGILVVATAANDALERGAYRSDVNGSIYRNAMRALAERFADRCVVLVNARTRVSPIYYPVGAAVVNRDLFALAETHENIVIVDWDNTSAGLAPGAFVPDQLHFGVDPAAPAEWSYSAEAYARAIAGGVQRCHDRVVAAADPTRTVPAHGAAAW